MPSLVGRELHAVQQIKSQQFHAMRQARRRDRLQVDVLGLSLNGRTITLDGYISWFTFKNPLVIPFLVILLVRTASVV